MPIPLDLLYQGRGRRFPWEEDLYPSVRTTELEAGPPPAAVRRTQPQRPITPTPLSAYGDRQGTYSAPTLDLTPTPLSPAARDWTRRYNSDLGGRGTLDPDPLRSDPGPRGRVTSPTNGQPPPPAMPPGMPQGYGAQPASAPGPPSGQISPTGQPSKGWIGRAKDYLNEPAFPRDEFGQPKPMSRGNLIGEMLMGAGQAIGTSKAGTGMLMAGLGGATTARNEARAAEEKRVQEASNDWYKRLKGQADLAQAQRGDVKVVGNKLVRVDLAGGVEVLAEGDALATEPSNAFQAAWRALPPEQRTPDKALQLQQQLSERPVTDYQRQQLELERERNALRRQEASRPRGSGSAPAPTQLAKAIEERNALPPGDPRIADYDRLIASIGRASGSTAASGTPLEPGFVPLTTTQLTRAQESIVAADEVLAKVKNIEDFGADLDDLTTTRGQVESAVTSFAERTGLPVTDAAQQFLAKKAQLTSAIEDLSGAIRHERFGAALTSKELAKATQNLPDPGDSITQLRSKLAELKKLARQVANRQAKAIRQGLDVRERPEEPEQPPPPPTGQAAPAGRPAAPGGDVPEPPPGMLMPDYARMLHRNGFSIKEARRLAQEKYEQP